jgi:hypothetical protein
MAKVLTERPRTRSWEERRKTGRRIRIQELDDELDVPTEVSREPSGRRRVYHDYKSFTDHIMPLKRYLEAQVGRPWNDVWSEMCQTLDRRSMSGNHVFEHIRWEVETKTVMVGDEVHEYIDGSGTTRPVERLFVHPVTGILSYKKPKPYRPRRTRDQNKRRLSAGRYLIRVEGIWYEALYDRREEEPISSLLVKAGFGQPRPYHVIEERERRSWDELRVIGNRTHYFHRTEKTVYWVRRSKRQLSGRELRKHGLENTPNG